MKHAGRATEQRDGRNGRQDVDALFTVLSFSFTGLLGCLVSLAPLDGPAFTVAKSLSLLASLVIALTGLGFGGAG